MAAMSYSGMKGQIELGSDLMSRKIREELGDVEPLPPGTVLVLNTCEALIPQKNGGTYAKRLSILNVAPCLARTPARRREYGVTVSYER
jgi:hypothetical protein